MTKLELVAPDDWWRIPLDDEARMARAVKELVDRQFKGLDNQPLLRRDAAQRITEQAQQAAAQGGIDMYLSYTAPVGVPLALSLTVSLVPAPPGHVSIRSVAHELQAAGHRAEVVELPHGTAVRRQRVTRPDVLDAMEVPDQVEVVACDYFLEGPDDTLLLLAFSSPLAEVADALADLFHAVAGTVHWTDA